MKPSKIPNTKYIYAKQTKFKSDVMPDVEEYNLK